MHFHRFKTALRLMKHKTVHTDIKPHKCDVCNREFREKGTLNEHLRIHTGAMPFSCEFCNKKFRFKGVLTVNALKSFPLLWFCYNFVYVFPQTHRRLHTGERPYSCLECNHHFTNWPNYNKHMKRRHGRFATEFLLDFFFAFFSLEHFLSFQKELTPV